jgi:hypothetical protein
MMRLLLLTLTLLTSLGISSPVIADDFTVCANGRRDGVIPACSRAIASGLLKGRAASVAYTTATPPITTGESSIVRLPTSIRQFGSSQK